MKHYKKALFIWLIGALFFLYEFFLRVFPNSIHGEIQSSFNTNAFTFALLGSAFYICYSVLQVPVGIIINKYGVRKSLFFAALVSTLGAVLFATTESLHVAILARCFMGIGAAFGFLGLLSIATESFPSKYIGLLSGSTQILGALGPILAGAPLLYAVSVTNSWRTVLGMVAAFGIILTVSIFIFMSDSKKSGESQSKGIWTDIKKCCSNKRLNVTYLYAFLIYCSIPTFGAIWGVTFLEERGLSAAYATDAISCLWLGLGIGSPLFGMFYDSFRTKINVLSLVSIVGFIALIVLYSVEINYLTASILMFIVGCAAAGQTLSFTVISRNKEIESRAIAFGINNTVVMLSGFIVPLSIGAMINSLDLNITKAFLLLPVAFILAMLVSFFVKAKE